jgi:hypothetical protein
MMLACIHTYQDIYMFLYVFASAYMHLTLHAYMLVCFLSVFMILHRNGMMTRTM